MKMLVHSGCPLVLTGDARGLAVTCLEGDLWVTQQGDGQDHMVGAGESFVVDRRGRVVVSSLQEAELAVSGRGRRVLGLRLWRARLVPRGPRPAPRRTAESTSVGRAA